MRTRNERFEGVVEYLIDVLVSRRIAGNARIERETAAG
jgi:hypothetical protein